MPPSTKARPCRVKGSALAARLTWVRLYHGEAGIERVCEHARRELDEVLAIPGAGIDIAAWYPIEQFIALNQSIDDCLGRGDLALVKELGRYSADAMLTTVLRAYLHATTVEAMLARAERIWAIYFDSGQLLVREFSDGEVEIEIADFARPSRIHCLAVQGWIERGAELGGATSVMLREVDCRARGEMRCRFRITWQRDGGPRRP